MNKVIHSILFISEESLVPYQINTQISYSLVECIPLLFCFRGVVQVCCLLSSWQNVVDMTVDITAKHISSINTLITRPKKPKVQSIFHKLFKVNIQNRSFDVIVVMNSTPFHFLEMVSVGWNVHTKVYIFVYIH